jgi:outer membrane protein assembly factor BamB
VARWKLLVAKDRLLSLQWNDTVCTGLKGIDMKSGKEIWSQQPPENSEWVAFRPLLWRNLILAGSRDGHLIAFDTQTGLTAWAIKLNGSLKSIGAADPLIYAGSSNGSLYAIAPP